MPERAGNSQSGQQGARHIGCSRGGAAWPRARRGWDRHWSVSVREITRQVRHKRTASLFAREFSIVCVHTLHEFGRSEPGKRPACAALAAARLTRLILCLMVHAARGWRGGEGLVFGQARFAVPCLILSMMLPHRAGSPSRCAFLSPDCIYKLCLLTFVAKMAGAALKPLC